MSKSEDSKGKKKEKEPAQTFVELTRKYLGEDFVNYTADYSGTLVPEIARKAESWNTPGSVPLDMANIIFSSGTIADLATKPILWNEKPELEAQAKKVYQEIKPKMTEDDVFPKFVDYQESIMLLASSVKVIEKTFSVTKTDTAWVETTKANLKWVKELVKSSIAKIYQSMGGLRDRVTSKISEILELLKQKIENIMDRFVGAVRELAQRLLGLLTEIISGLFSWANIVNKIAEENDFSLSKVRIAIDPFSIKVVSLLGFSIPIPEIKTPKIEFEFEKD
jgi:hypothetical protein